jgi:hypothetical protein
MSLAYICMSGRELAMLALQVNKKAGVNENYSKFEVCAVVRFLQAEGVSQSKIHCRLVSD